MNKKCTKTQKIEKTLVSLPEVFAEKDMFYNSENLELPFPNTMPLIDYAGVPTRGFHGARCAIEILGGAVEISMIFKEGDGGVRNSIIFIFNKSIIPNNL